MQVSSHVSSCNDTSESETRRGRRRRPFLICLSIVTFTVLLPLLGNLKSFRMSMHAIAECRKPSFRCWWFRWRRLHVWERHCTSNAFNTRNAGVSQLVVYERKSHIWVLLTETMVTVVIRYVTLCCLVEPQRCLGGRYCLQYTCYI
jgi:hypothetical protein